MLQFFAENLEYNIGFDFDEIAVTQKCYQKRPVK